MTSATVKPSIFLVLRSEDGYRDSSKHAGVQLPVYPHASFFLRNSHERTTTYHFS